VHRVSHEAAQGAGRVIPDLPHGRVLTVPIGLLASGLPLQARVLASAGFTPARIAALLGADEADVQRVLEG
jgi:hypothetical protein